jgi:small subunit ribosomal protein S13
LARIAGVDLPRDKRIEIGLTYIYGIGRSISRRILDKLGIGYDIKTDQLSESEINKSYRGLRHRKSLPVRGQRTSTNARTRKGPRRSAVKKRGGATKK